MDLLYSYFSEFVHDTGEFHFPFTTHAVILCLACPEYHPLGYSKSSYCSTHPDEALQPPKKKKVGGGRKKKKKKEGM